MARLKVSRSGFHAWNGRSPSPCVVRDKLLLVQIRSRLEVAEGRADWALAFWVAQTVVAVLANWLSVSSTASLVA